MMLFVEKLSWFYKYILSVDVVILNVCCGGEWLFLSVVDKVKLFIVLVESGGVILMLEENFFFGFEEIVEDKGIY